MVIMTAPSNMQILNYHAANIQPAYAFRKNLADLGPHGVEAEIFKILINANRHQPIGAQCVDTVFIKMP
jgi:hypothetical protein